MAALSAGSGVNGATINRVLNKLQYAVPNVANAIDAIATGDKYLVFDASADYEPKLVEAQTAGSSGRVVTTTSTGLALTAALHAERMVLINTNSSGTSTFTLPTAAATGARYHLINNLQQTQGTIVITGATGDTITGKAIMLDSTAAADAMTFMSTATSIKATWNRTTQGGLGYDEFVAVDIAANKWLVTVTCNGSGSLITPLSA